MGGEKEATCWRDLVAAFAYCDGVEACCRSEGLHSARPRVIRRKAVAINWQGSDTDYG